jgi:hypothetical protein
MARLLNLLGRASLELQAAEGEKPARRRFAIVASTGEPLRGQGPYGWGYPVVVDLDGIQCAQQIPVLDNHGPPPGSDRPARLAIVGQSDSTGVEGGAFVVRGPFFQEEQAAQEIIRLADQGFAWQASIGATCLAKDFIADGNTVSVNGRTYEGPLYVSRKTLIREVSFVVIGDDPKTSVLVAGGSTFEDWCRTEHGCSPEELPAKVRSKLREEYDGQAEDDDDQDDDDASEDSAPDTGARQGGKHLGDRKRRKREGAEDSAQEAEAAGTGGADWIAAELQEYRGQAVEGTRRRRHIEAGGSASTYAPIYFPPFNVP